MSQISKLLRHYIYEVMSTARVPNQLINPEDEVSDPEQVEEASAGGVVGSVGAGGFTGEFIPPKKNNLKK